MTVNCTLMFTYWTAVGYFKPKETKQTGEGTYQMLMSPVLCQRPTRTLMLMIQFNIVLSLNVGRVEKWECQYQPNMVLYSHKNLHQGFWCNSSPHSRPSIYRYTGSDVTVCLKRMTGSVSQGDCACGFGLRKWKQTTAFGWDRDLLMTNQFQQQQCVCSRNITAIWVFLEFT